METLVIGGHGYRVADQRTHGALQHLLLDLEAFAVEAEQALLQLPWLAAPGLHHGRGRGQDTEGIQHGGGGKDGRLHTQPL